MRNYIFGLLILFLFLASCGKSKDKNHEDYLSQVVGRMQQGKYIVNNAENIKNKWGEWLKEEGLNPELESFDIVSGKAEGEHPAEYYVLIAKNADGKVKIASLLTLIGDEFYFEKRQGPEYEVSINIICSGCAEGCDPIVTIQNDIMYLNCSQCIDCIKSEKGIR